MKKIKFQTRNRFFIFLLILSLFPVIQTRVASASVAGDLAEIASNFRDVFRYVEDQTAHVKSYMQTAQNVYQTGRMAIDTAKSLKNFDLETFSKNVAGDNLLQLGDVILNDLASVKGVDININTGGGSVVTNLGNFLDKISVNEIKKGIANIKNSYNTTPYTAEINQSIVDFVRKTSDTALGKVVNFTLPYIAKDEICNSPKLKDVIKNGEPETFVRPKKAVGNVDIDKLCNTSLQSPQKQAAEAQAAFVGLAKAGYGGPRTNTALSDSANTPSGVVAMTISTILAQKDKVVDEASRQTEATGMFLGRQKCMDKDGKPVNYDPTKPDLYCYQTNSSVQNSGALSREQASAATDAPFNALLAKAGATNDKLGDGMSKAFNIMNKINGILSIGQRDIDDIVSGLDNPYSSLANSLTSLQQTQKIQNTVFKKGQIADNEYYFGTDGYTLDDLKETLDVYGQIRKLNTQKLNEHAYTYLVLKYSVNNSKKTVDDAAKNAYNQQRRVLFFFIGRKRARQAVDDWGDKAQAAKLLTTALINESAATRQLIKEMSLNNFREQQIRKLLERMRGEENIDTENNQEALAQALEGAYTLKSYQIMEEDWNYMPQYQELDTDPTTSDDISRYIPTKDEVEGPYTRTNLTYLRIRAYKMLRDAIKGGANTTLPTDELAIINAYGVSSLNFLTPNLERPARATALLDSDESLNYSEAAYCNHIKLPICNMSELTTLIETLDSFGDTNMNPQLQSDMCANPETSVRNLCNNSTAADLAVDMDLSEMCKDETSIQTAIQDFRDGCLMPQ